MVSAASCQGLDFLAYPNFDKERGWNLLGTRDLQLYDAVIVMKKRDQSTHYGGDVLLPFSCWSSRRCNNVRYVCTASGAKFLERLREPSRERNGLKVTSVAFEDFKTAPFLSLIGT